MMLLQNAVPTALAFTYMFRRPIVQTRKTDRILATK
jgi:hypothetical protein